jgi:hypothetical protein
MSKRIQPSSNASSSHIIDESNSDLPEADDQDLTVEWRRREEPLKGFMIIITSGMN